MTTVTEIRTPRRGSRRRTLVLDGEPWRDVPSDVLAKTGIRLGSEVDPAGLAERLAEIEPQSARDRAVRLLTYRERSVKELTERLADDGYLTATVAGVIERLVSVGILDDRRFAHSLARSLTQLRRLGRNRAARELASHGIDPELSSEALDEAMPIADEASTALALAMSYVARSGATREKVAGRLARRGYAPGVAVLAARTAMDAVASSLEDDGWIDPDDFDEPCDETAC